MFDNLPVNLETKVNSSKRVQMLAGVESKYFVSNSEINKIAAAIDELHSSETSTSNTLSFHNKSGVTHIRAGNEPLTGNLIIDPANNKKQGWVDVMYNGNSNPNITGVEASLIKLIPGNITISTQGIYKIAIFFDGIYYLVGIINLSTQYTGAGGGNDNLIAPTSFSAGTSTTTTIPLTWEKSVSGVMTEYRVYQGESLLQTFTGDVEAGTLTGLSTNTAYNNLTVRGYDGSEETPSSNSINASTAAGAGDETAPETPSITLVEDAS